VQVVESNAATAVKSAASATMPVLLRGDPSLALLENGVQSTALRTENPAAALLRRLTLAQVKARILHRKQDQWLVLGLAADCLERGERTADRTEIQEGRASALSQGATRRCWSFAALRFIPESA